MMAALIACGAARADPSPSPEAASADAALDRALQKLVAMPGGPLGVVAVVQRGDELKVHSFGTAKDGADRRPGANMHMRIASVAKAFSGAAALSLVSRGTLSLDDTIGKHLPELPAAWANVTLRQLLGHTSGIPDYSKSTKFREALEQSLLDAPKPQKLPEFIKGRGLTFTPGSKYRYSNTDNIIVALMVRAAIDNSYNRALKDQVYDPLELTRTSLPKGAAMPRPFIHGYDNDPDANPPEDVSELVAAGWAWASGGVVSTPAELNRFIRGYVGGRLFDAHTQAEQREVIVDAHSEPPGPGQNSAGLAIFRYETTCGTVWGHTGNTLGYTQFAAASGNGRRSVTVSINRQITPDVGAPGVFKALRQAEELAVCAALAR
ncbi:class A beta-lactamase-related serine hydrolase [Hansschlegelia zhihuaiae]|uniref:Class A beta-lactamase-related serine hydrolase n=2 Tax=Hansschlegelia zhihuaiae TaxID=405005 RepID=A0A4Q0MM44_9HYPH|nr:class A beta-lactamase-related serine hydrolase [Hansschlegelia zhihuaiae]